MNELAYKLKRWFNINQEYKHYFNIHKFFRDVIIFIVILIALLIIHSNIITLNTIKILFFRVGAILLWILFFFFINYLKKLWENTTIVVRYLNHGWRYLGLIILLILTIIIYLDQENYVALTKEKFNSYDFSSLNPIDVEILNTDAVSNNLPSTAPSKISNLIKSQSSTPSYISTCKTRVEDEAEAVTIRDRGDFSYNIDEYKILNSINDVNTYIKKYQTTTISDDKICVTLNEYIVVRVIFRNVGNNPGFVDKYTNIWVCDGSGNIVSKESYC